MSKHKSILRGEPMPEPTPEQRAQQAAQEINAVLTKYKCGIRPSTNAEWRIHRWLIGKLCGRWIQVQIFSVA